tara:strand:- start:347 stop:541 length:195 start_codon:yes stop_codon:yes gene_type:complete
MDLLIDIMSYASMFVAVSSAICAATPTPADEKFLGKWVYPVIEILALQIGSAKMLPGENPKAKK